MVFYELIDGRMVASKLHFPVINPELNINFLRTIEKVIGMGHYFFFQGLGNITLNRKPQFTGIILIKSGSYVPFNNVCYFLGITHVFQHSSSYNRMFNGTGFGAADIMQQATDTNQFNINIVKVTGNLNSFS